MFAITMQVVIQFASFRCSQVLTLSFTEETTPTLRKNSSMSEVSVCVCVCVCVCVPCMQTSTRLLGLPTTSSCMQHRQLRPNSRASKVTYCTPPPPTASHSVNKVISTSTHSNTCTCMYVHVHYIHVTVYTCHSRL